MLSNLASSLILHKRVSTTVAKAKALRKYVEPLLTKSKNDTTHSRRTVFAYLQNKESVKELFDEVSVKIANRPGGYTRILKTGYRLGDNAEMCVIELVDYNEDMLTTTGTAAAGAKKTRRRGGKKKAEGTATEVTAAEAPETPAAESNDATEDTKDAK
ncbi:LSU ribosomal protein L17P [Pontibacter mucosus]|uniref:50S ribosomal protein L17 n=2 Tax=Pontibacter mucosus TaxID=1649266 RepID=A0A2T5YER1_9BACT|nr:LSU ribosomal protein L17P [Pontibacter mucosus]